MIYFLLFIGFIGLTQAVPTPNSWWKWRIVKKGNNFYPQAIGPLKPYWHYVLNNWDMPISFISEQECREFLHNDNIQIIPI
jgi:hypothetical protein